MVTEFEGMGAWEPGSEIIECRDTTLGNVDLHNDCDFTGVDVLPGEKGLTVGLRFERTEGSARSGFELYFHEVRDLALTSRAAEFPEDVGVFHAIEYVQDPASGARFAIDAEVLTVSLTCRTVQFAPVG